MQLQFLQPEYSRTCQSWNHAVYFILQIFSSFWKYLIVMVSFICSQMLFSFFFHPWSTALNLVVWYQILCLLKKILQIIFILSNKIVMGCHLYLIFIDLSILFIVNTEDSTIYFHLVKSYQLVHCNKSKLWNKELSIKISD